MLLEDAGLTVVGWAADAAEALKLAEHGKPDLALVDIQLKRGDDGVAVARELSDRWNIGVIFVTAQSDPKTKLRAEQTSHLGYLVKPYAGRELLRLIGGLGSPSSDA